jgi:hypothetical protein
MPEERGGCSAADGCPAGPGSPVGRARSSPGARPRPGIGAAGPCPSDRRRRTGAGPLEVTSRITGVGGEQFVQPARGPQPRRGYLVQESARRQAGGQLARASNRTAAAEVLSSAERVNHSCRRAARVRTTSSSLWLRPIGDEGATGDRLIGRLLAVLTAGREGAGNAPQADTAKRGSTSDSTDRRG